MPIRKNSWTYDSDSIVFTLPGVLTPLAYIPGLVLLGKVQPLNLDTEKM